MQPFLFILILALLLSSLPSHCDDANQPRHILPIAKLSVIDGDSYRVFVNVWPGQQNQTILRLRGYDAPESTWRAECDREGKLGVRATHVADSLIAAAHTLELVDPGWDKYGGRILGVLLLDGESIGPRLEAMGLLKPYDGKGAKPDWCPAQGKTSSRRASWGGVKDLISVAN